MSVVVPCVSLNAPWTLCFRTRLQSDAPQHAILQPLDVELLVTRNLSASWFRRAPGVQVQGVLRALKVGPPDLVLS